MTAHSSPSPVVAKARRFGTVLVGATLVLPPLVVLPSLDEPFRLGKLLLSETLGLASVCFLAAGLWRLDRVPFVRLLTVPALRAVVPFLIVATSTLLATTHPEHVRSGLGSLWIGAVCLVAWSFLGARLRPLLDLILIPSTLLAVVAILQFHGLLRSFVVVGGRLGVTSLAGSVGDLGAYLVLPCLLAQVKLLASFRAAPADGRKRRRRLSWIGYGAVVLLLHYALSLTLTVTAVAALALGSVVLWACVLPPGRRWRTIPAVLLLLVVTVLLIAPLRERAVRLSKQVRSGRIAGLLSGRTDGWLVALRICREHPYLGAGHGAYVAEFSGSKLDLLDDGVNMYDAHRQSPIFGNAHNELLEVLAETGGLGMLALLFAMVEIVRRAWQRHQTAPDRQSVADQPLVWAGLTALIVLSCGYFPFRIALTAYPGLAFLAWILTPFTENEPS